ncbi:MAG: prolyl oligopeptidase family serine peptidase [Bacteroidales bacterium]|nr:prolyl oligopeptidase family serine peptidase [Bacteroidales bacterium]
MKQTATLFAVLLLLIFSCKTNKKENTEYNYPETMKDSTVDEYFGTKVPDPYSWLEDDNSEATKAWVKAQNEFTFSYLNKIPFKDKIKNRLEEIWNYEKKGAPFKKGNYYYFYKNDGLQNQYVLYRTKELGKNAEIFLDPNTFSEDGTVSMSSISYTKDGSLAAYQISEGGSDWRKVIIIDTENKKQLEDTLVDIKFSGLAWKGNEGFYYSSYDKPKEGSKLSGLTQYHKLFFHTIGTSQKDDRLIFGGEKQKRRYLGAYLTEDQRFLVITASESTSGNELYVKDLTTDDSNIVPVMEGFDSDLYVVDNQGTRLLIHTNYKAPNNRLVEVDASNPKSENWKDLIPETENVMSVNTGGGYLFASYMVDVKSQVIQFDYSGKKIREVELPAIGTTYGFSEKKDEKELYYTFTSFTYPATIFKYDIEKGTSELYWKPNISFNPDDFETKQVFYKSKDGTKIPMFIVYKKGLELNGKNPTYLYAYGGFNISLKPGFDLRKLVWLENGGIYAQPNIRGGGEYGEKWHKAGTKMNKQNVFDDFIAAAEYLFKEKYTSSDYLAIAGGSNGGLLIGATITQRPDLAKVAFPAVGVMDMLKYHKFTSGAGWASDYGTSEESEEMFKYLLNYSPVHAIKEGVNYPATMVTTADHDDRVVPAHSFKFAATLQAKAKSNNPLLIRIETNAGHGAGTPTSKQIEQVADKFAFAWYNMGINPFKN